MTVKESEKSIEYIDSRIIKNYHRANYFNEGKIFFTLFNKEININVDFDVSLEYAEKCVECLNSLNDNIIEQLCKESIKYCEDFRELFEENKIVIPENIDGRKILEYIIPNTLIVNNPKDDKIGFHLECDCVWEIEHGLEWTIKDDKILYVGQFGNYDAWYNEDFLKTYPYNYINN